MTDTADHSTTGDQHEIDCPWCGKNLALWEVVGSMTAGDEIACDHCEKAIEVVSIDYTVDLCLDRKEPK